MTEERPQLSIVGPRELTAAPGWRLERIAGPSDLFGANGIQFGPDGRLYVAQALGAQVSAIDIATGQIDHVLSGGPIIAPDDIDFGRDGTAFITDVATATTWAWRPGEEPVAHAINQPANNGVTATPNGRLFIDEFRPGGRLLEGPREHGQDSRVILDGLDGPNALDQASDGRLYFPQVFAGEVWSVDPDSGVTQRIAAGLGSPTAVKVAADDQLIVSLSAEGVIAQIDPRSGAISTLAEVPTGIDNLALDEEGGLYVSHYVDGRVARVPVGVGANTQEPRILNPAGFVGPFDVAERPGGTLIVADGLSLAYIEGHLVSRTAQLLTADSPGMISAVHVAADGRTFVAGRNAVWQYTPAGPRQIRADFQAATGLALDGDDTLLLADHEAGVVYRLHPGSGDRTDLTREIRHPTRLSVASDGAVYITDDQAGRLYVQRDGATIEVTADLEKPQGVVADEERVFVVDAGSQELVAVTRLSGQREVLAAGLPVGVPAGGARLVAAAGLTRTADGSLVIAADGDGSLLRLQPA